MLTHTTESWFYYLFFQKKNERNHDFVVATSTTKSWFRWRWICEKKNDTSGELEKKKVKNWTCWGEGGGGGGLGRRGIGEGKKRKKKEVGRRREKEKEREKEEESSKGGREEGGWSFWNS